VAKDVQITVQESVTCGVCGNFEPNTTGSTAGIGTCRRLSDFIAGPFLDGPSSYDAIMKFRKRLGFKPCWPRAERFCGEFVGTHQ
jgi:hypothetical protein